MDIFITGCILAIAAFFTGYQLGKEVGKVEGQVAGRKAMRRHYEQVGR